MFSDIERIDFWTENVQAEKIEFIKAEGMFDIKPHTTELITP